MNIIWVITGQIMSQVTLEWEDSLIKRCDRKRTLAILADPINDITPAQLHGKIRAKTESLDFPDGYSLEWGGEYEAQQDANRAVFEFVPLGVLIMIVLTVLLFSYA